MSNNPNITRTNQNNRQKSNISNSMSAGTFEIKELRDNLKDLDYISNKLLVDMKNKNEILQNGLNDCKDCARLINNNKMKPQNNQ